MKRVRIPLTLKVLVAVLVIVAYPLIISNFMIGQISERAATVNAIDASSRIAALEKSIGAYHDLVDVTKRLHAEIADRLSHRKQLLALDPTTNLDAILDGEPGLRGIEVIAADGHSVMHAAHPLPTGGLWRDKEVDQPLGEAGDQLKLTFIVSATLTKDLQDLKDALDAARNVARISAALPEGFRFTFLLAMTIAAVLALGLAMWGAIQLTRRIGVLNNTARAVSQGKVEQRARVLGNDEIAELARVFNTMLNDLEAGRQQIAYLQRMGAWEDVARRLAHEIKNPLTPIQLAVQQCVSSYKGADTDPVRFKRTLTDTGEIVEEEIASLRRLVDTFRTLGALPKVAAIPVKLGEVIEELRLDPTVRARLTLVPPEKPVTVRADKLLLKRVLANLVENGIHAGQEAGGSGDVVVGWAEDAAADVVKITVDDHGKGVAEVDREKIFEPYVTTKATGTGLGLAIARKIAIEHGGELAVANDKAPTGGARFVISLPSRA